jgi:alanyl-tRNA synthetase
MTIKAELKIIADHLRSSCFLIADGILPDNEGRGYVLRRIMRRAMLQLHKLGTKKAIMHELTDVLIKEMGASYPELKRARSVIIETLKNEEEKFRETLDKGLKILEEEIAIMLKAPKNNTEIAAQFLGNSEKDAFLKIPLQNSQTAAATPVSRQKFSGEIAFRLYDTYGFPLDLTQDILKEKNIIADEEAFNLAMKNQRQRARQNWSGSGEKKEDGLFFELKKKYGATKFLGYETTAATAKILAIETIADKKQEIVILNQTPFYATSGGQKGDDGKIICGANVMEISETRKFADNLFVHFIAGVKGEFKAGDEVRAEVNFQNRQFRACNHSATHLLHKALKEILGSFITQKGSNVDSQYFTFDFNFNRPLTLEEIIKIEDRVNFNIRQNITVNTDLMPLKKAYESGAEALFGEKYDAEVRVVAIGSSVELCGGTHVKATGNIAIFKIISESGIAAGIRRINAKTGQFVISHQRKSETEAALVIADLQRELKKQDKEIAVLKKQLLLAALKNLKTEKIADITLISHCFQNAEATEIREISNELKAKKDFQNSCIFAFFSIQDRKHENKAKSEKLSFSEIAKADDKENDKILACICVSANLFARFDAAKLIVPVIEAIKGKAGGGKKDLAMGGGTDRKAIPQAIEILKNLIQKSCFNT